MRARRFTPALALPAVIFLGGCGYVHLGKLPEPTTTVIGDDKLMRENSDLRAEKKILERELALTRAQGDALRTAIENRAADGDTSRRLAEKLNEATRELTTLRINYAQLKSERDTAFATASESNALRARLDASEGRLAETARTNAELQGEVTRLQSEVEKTRSENLALSAQVRTITAQNEQAQAAVAQLNTQLLAQKDARARAEQDAETLRTQLAAAPNASALAQQRTGAAGEARTLAAEQAQEIIALRKELDTFRAKVGELETERTQLKQQLGSSVPSPDLANIEAKLATSLRTNSLLRDENEQLKATSIELNATKADLETQLARLKNSPAAAQASALREQLREAQAAATALTEENARLKTRLASGERPSGNRVVISPEPVTRLNLDAPTAGPRAAAATPPPAGEGNGVPAPDASEASTTTRTASGGTITRTNGTGVSATLVTTVPGSRPAASAPGAGRVHVVAGGDTLSKISMIYYGTPARWSDILAANRDILGENNNLVIGRTLRIP